MEDLNYLKQELKKVKFTKNLAITSICISSLMIGINIVLVIKNHKTNQDLTFAGISGIVLYSSCIAYTSYKLIDINAKYKNINNKIKTFKQ